MVISAVLIVIVAFVIFILRQFKHIERDMHHY